jgi:hypothetical protein
MMAGLLCLLRASEPARVPIAAFHTGLGRQRASEAGGGGGGHGAGGRRRRSPQLRLHYPLLCLATLGEREWVLVDLKPALDHFFKLA